MHTQFNAVLRQPEANAPSMRTAASAVRQAPVVDELLRARNKWGSASGETRTNLLLVRTYSVRLGLNRKGSIWLSYLRRWSAAV